MSQELGPFSPEALERLAQIIGENYTGSQITSVFSRSGYPEIVHDGGTKWRFVVEALEQLQRRGSNRPQHVIKVLQTICSPQGWIEQRPKYESFLSAINQVLEFYGLQVRDDGTFHTQRERASTVRHTKGADERAFDDRGFHPMVIKHGKSHFSRGAFFHAVFEVCKAFDAEVKTKSGFDEHGQSLMGKALSLSGPLKINSQRSQSERDEQDGIKFLCMGLMNAVRNPQAHEPELSWPMSKDDALDVLALTSFLFRKIESATFFDSSSIGAGR
jgi:uncharacterized protein (TIGR02391 family)